MLNINMKLLIILSVCFYLRIGIAQQLSNGDVCENNKGTCIPLKDCSDAMTAFQNGIYPETCGFEENQPLVCCQTESISEINCKRYSGQSAAMFPQFEVFSIVGGVATAPKEFPHMAALGYSNGNNIIFICGGSLVSEKFVLTAAHCISSMQYGLVQAVRLGDVNITPQSSGSTSKDYRVKRRIRHPSYQSPSLYNDIALIELDGSVVFNNFIKPACLYNNNNIPSNTELIATGWGLTEYGGNKSDTLQKVILDLFTEKECNDHYSHESARRLKDGIVSNTQICAGGRNSNKDACQGDSGGPLQTYRSIDRIYSIVGITSFGKACGVPNVPGVYTRVSYYVPWLETIIWPNN